MTEPTGRPTLTYALRGLLWGIESEVAIITNLSRQIDERVTEVNAARTELVERLARLAELVSVTDDSDLEAFLLVSTEVSMPSQEEHFPDRLYS